MSDDNPDDSLDEQPEPEPELDEETEALVNDVDEMLDDIDRRHENEEDREGAITGPQPDGGTATSETPEPAPQPRQSDDSKVWQGAGGKDDADTDEAEEEDEGEVPYWQEVGGLLAYPFVFVFGAFWGVFKGITFTILGRVPKRVSIFQGLINFGYNGLYRKTKGQFVVNCIYGDGAVVPWPAEYDKQELKVRSVNGEEWTAVQGIDLDRMGDTPVAWGVADDHEIVRPVQARVAEAVDAGTHRVQAIRWSDSAQPERVNFDMGAGQAQQAMADGGAVTIEELFPTYDDVLVNAKNPLFGSDGWLVSMKKAYELHWSQAGTEEMQKQEDRGRLAELDPGRRNKMVLYILIAALGGTALGLLGPALATRIAGGASSAGSALPIFIDVASMAGVV